MSRILLRSCDDLRESELELGEGKMLEAPRRSLFPAVLDLGRKILQGLGIFDQSELRGNPRVSYVGGRRFGLLWHIRYCAAEDVSAQTLDDFINFGGIHDDLKTGFQASWRSMTRTGLPVPLLRGDWLAASRAANRRRSANL